MTSEQEAKLTELYKKELDRQRNFGIKVGVLAASRVVLGILEDSAKPLMKRIADIKSYCKTSENIAKEIISEDNSESLGEVEETGEEQYEPIS